MDWLQMAPVPRQGRLDRRLAAVERVENLMPEEERKAELEAASHEREGAERFDYK